MYPLLESRGLFMDISHLWMQEGWEEVIPEKLKVLSQRWRAVLSRAQPLLLDGVLLS